MNTTTSTLNNNKIEESQMMATSAFSLDMHRFLRELNTSVLPTGASLPGQPAMPSIKDILTLVGPDISHETLMTAHSAFSSSMHNFLRDLNTPSPMAKPRPSSTPAPKHMNHLSQVFWRPRDPEAVLTPGHEDNIMRILFRKRINAAIANEASNHFPLVRLGEAGEFWLLMKVMRRIVEDEEEEEVEYKEGLAGFLNRMEWWAAHCVSERVEGDAGVEVEGVMRCSFGVECGWCYDEVRQAEDTDEGEEEGCEIMKGKVSDDGTGSDSGVEF
ncbi:hypothetical protein G7K_3959-t1 [Saitoella complicata NRRL Y-17804]|uniref:Uncharacterized protein n=1 Tax=Saitoella complicata (strain BCRC 22490 / CBS 7301 / JCM 7358 / NBRC 10748 / NRRL Y-17804) TaxID=698492 RepID=A0A0E9NJE2_SAICN|nr:hypothetical protein G7K_3959-t1 [Saitoella complicata NRRL Y-17804]